VGVDWSGRMNPMIPSEQEPRWLYSVVVVAVYDETSEEGVVVVVPSNEKEDSWR